MSDELKQRIDKAIDRIIAGHSPQRIPADMTDADIVLTDCKTALDAANQREAAIWAALSRAGVSHGQSVEGLKEGLAAHAEKLRAVAERQREACALRVQAEWRFHGMSSPAHTCMSTRLVTE